MANSDNKNSRNKALRDLLKKDPNSVRTADDFEKEALEGFGLLGDEDEILAIKEKLDERMDSEVFAGQKRSNKPAYWLAAAALIIIVGFAVFFVQNAEVSKPKDLAILQSKKPEMAPVPAEPAYLETEAPLSENKNTKSVPILRSADRQQPGLSSPSEDQTENRVVQEVPNLKSLKTRGKNDAEMTDVTGGSGLGNNKPLAAPEEITVMKNQAAPPSSANAGSPSLAYNAGSGQAEISTVDKVTTKKSQAKKMEPKATKDLSSNCYYKGGDKALQKELKHKLTQKNLLKPFNAKLLLSSEKKVEKVEFINSTEFSAEEQTEVINVIKTLTDFEFHETPKGTDLSEYLLIFKR